MLGDRNKLIHRFYNGGRLFCGKNYKNYRFIARIIILFVFLYYRNSRYGNEYYDKA